MPGKEILFYFALFFSVITIPLGSNLNSWAIAAFCITAFFQSPLKHNFQKLRQHSYWLLSIAFFLVLLLVDLYHSGAAFSFRHIEGHASFLVLPLVFTVAPRLSIKTIRLLCYAFTASVVVISLICLLKSYQEYQINADINVFFYHNLGYQMGLNAIFLSNYAVAGITWLLYFQYIEKRQPIKIPVLIIVFTCCYLAFVTFLLSSKLIIPIMLLFVIFLVFRIGYLHQQLKRSFIAFIALGIIVLVSVEHLPYLQERWRTTKISLFDGDNNNSFAARTAMWGSSIELIREKPLLGYGMVGWKDEIKQEYQEKDYTDAVTHVYNAHNQFLQSWMSGGIVALILFILLLAVPLRVAFTQKHLLLLMLLFHYICQSMVEATLTVQQELVFFWFFIFLFYYQWQVFTGSSDKKLKSEV